MELTVVGSGTAVPDPERVGSGYHVATGGLGILLDCGPGVVHHLARFRLPWSRLTHLAITHFHTDHIADIPALLFALRHGLAQPRREPLHVFGPTGTAGLFRRLADAFGQFILEPGFGLVIRELGSGDVVELTPGVTVTAWRTPHTGESLAYRLEAPDGVLAYTGDTGYDDGLARALGGAEVLIAECSLPEDLALDGHLTPTRAAAFAAAAEPRQLLITHVYPQLAGEDLPSLLRAAGWHGTVRVAHDGLRITL